MCDGVLSTVIYASHSLRVFSHLKVMSVVLWSLSILFFHDKKGRIEKRNPALYGILTILRQMVGPF